MSTLVIAEHSNNELKSATHHTVTAAQALGGEVHVLVAGQGCQAAAESAARIPGVAKVRVADNAAWQCERTSRCLAKSRQRLEI